MTSSGSGNLNSNDGPFVLRAHDFDPSSGADTLQKITVTPSGGQAVIVFSFQWDQPFLSSTTYAHMTDPTATSQPRGATGDLDMLIYDVNGVLVPLCPPDSLSALPASSRAPTTSGVTPSTLQPWS